MIFWHSLGTFETFQPSLTTQSDIKQNWAALSHHRRTSQLHCLQYFLLTRIECRFIYNEKLCTGQFDSFWRHKLFTMVPKSWDLQQTENWRPIVLVNSKSDTKFLPRCFMIVCNPCWKQNNQWIKLVFDEALVPRVGCLGNCLR